MKSYTKAALKSKERIIQETLVAAAHLHILSWLVLLAIQNKEFACMLQCEIRADFKEKSSLISWLLPCITAIFMYAFS